MNTLLTVVVVLAVLVLLGLALSVRIVQQYEKGVLFRLGRVIGVREPGLRLILPLIDVLRRGNERRRIPRLYVTHSPREASARRARLIALGHGRILASGSPHDVLD